MKIKKLTSGGFTLLEILIALTLSALIMLMLAMGMNLVVKEWTRSSNRLDDSIDKVLVLLQIERAIQGAFPYTYKDRDENKNYIFFEGDEEKMSWISTVSPGRQSGLMAWQLLPNDEKSGIDIRIVPALAGNPTERLEKHATAITVLQTYKAYFEYLYIDEIIEEDTKWLKTWSAQKQQGLPNAVRVHFTNNVEEPFEIVIVIQSYRHQKMTRIKP